MIPLRTPDTIYAELFEAVQNDHVFADSKTFVDAVPRRDPARIMDEFRQKKRGKAFDLKGFVEASFALPSCEEVERVSGAKRPVRQHIALLWDVLTRAADTDNPYSSLISLPHPYIVPGGRFREIYYWDSYFTMLGLADAGRHDAIADMVENFAFLIDEIGFIPNGNRTYFCSRSQPPFFVLMVELLATVRKDRGIVQKYLPQLRKEYEFWMHGADALDKDGAVTRRVMKTGGAFLNRYWDDRDAPRPESYAEDRAHAARTNRDSRDLYRNIRAACESGWDFSSRWFDQTESLESIRTTQILPVDLNALLHRLEFVLADAHRESGDASRADFFAARAGHRKQLLQELFFDEERGFFVDLDYPALEPTGVLSLAAAFPLFLEIATPAQAARIAKLVQDQFLAPGGWVTTLTSSGQQWDRPNGWAPLQWVVFAGLRNYGFRSEADVGAMRWVQNILNVYRHTNRLLEKYDVENIGALATGGEYAVQDGFGWTNAVLLRFMNHFGLE